MKPKTIGLALLAAGAVFALLLWRDRPTTQVLPDGTVLVLSGLQVGRSNVYAHGSPLSKALGRRVPAKGISVAGLKLQRSQFVAMPAPEGGEILTAELKLGPGSPQEKTFVSPPFYRKHRLLISGDDTNDFVFVKEFNGFKQQPDGLYSLIWAWSYPRDAHRLRFRLEERDKADNRDWREVTTFVVKNPKRATVAPWKAQNFPRLKLTEGLEVEVGELLVRPEPIHATDIWEDTAFHSVRIFSGGQLATNWGIADGKVSDAIGNQDGFSYSFTKRITNDWTEYRMAQPLDPSKVWKFQVNFARDADLPATNLFSFTVNWPLTSPVQTNLGGMPVQIDFVNVTMLSVQLTNKPAQTRVTFIKAIDETGADLSEWSGSWGQHGFWKSLKLLRTGVPAGPRPVPVQVTVGIHENYAAEFFLQPRYERKPKP